MNINPTSLPIISFILPVYNGEKYIEIAVKSILEQSFHDFEVIIIDDGSEDNSFNILNNLAVVDSRIRLYSRENKGLIATLNEAVQLARGEWIARMDADDICLPTRIENQLKYCIENEVDICGSHIEIFGSGVQKIRKYPLLDSEIRFGLAMNTQFAHPAVFGKAECFRSLKYSDSYKYCEDYELWVRAANSGYRLGNVDMVLLRYRLHPGQVSVIQANKQFVATLEISKMYREHVCAFKEKLDELNSNVLSPIECEVSAHPYFVVQQLLYIAKFYGCTPERIKDYLIFLSKRDRSIGFYGIYKCLGLIQIDGAKRLAIFLKCIIYKLAPLKLYILLKRIYYVA